MRMTGIGLIAAAALAGSVGIAVAQTSTTTTSPSAASPGTMKCWDSVTKQVRNEMPARVPAAAPAAQAAAARAAAARAQPELLSTSSSTKPPEAAGLPELPLIKRDHHPQRARWRRRGFFFGDAEPLAARICFAISEPPTRRDGPLGDTCPGGRR